jgi:hypothetical protein
LTPHTPNVNLTGSSSLSTVPIQGVFRRNIRDGDRDLHTTFDINSAATASRASALRRDHNSLCAIALAMAYHSRDDPVITAIFR